MIIGAGKSGTTTLYEWLKQHPQVFMSPVKETNFFALEGQDVVPSGNDPKQLRHYPWSITDRDEYEALFEGASSEKAIGEVSPMYLYSQRAPQVIKEEIPAVKLIAILRHPVDRLHSRYMHLVRESREPAKDYSQVFNRNSIWWERDDLVREGLYMQNLERYYHLFPAKQLRVYLYDDLKNNPELLLKDIFAFLEVDPDFSVDTELTFNPSGKIKNRWLDVVIGQNSALKSALGLVSPQLLNRLKNNQAVLKQLMKWRSSNLERIPMPKELRRDLIERIYGPEIFSLQKILGRDLSHWLN